MIIKLKFLIFVNIFNICYATIHFLFDENVGNDTILKLDVYKEIRENPLNPFMIDDNVTIKDESLSLIINNGVNMYEIVSEYCNNNNININDCISLIQYCKNRKQSSAQNKKLKFVIITYSFDETIGGVVVAHYLIDRLNYYFASTNDPVAYVMPLVGSDDNITWSTFYLNPKYNTPKMTILQFATDDDLIVIYPETIIGNFANKKMVVRWILYFLKVASDIIKSCQFEPDDYIACYSHGICTQFDDAWYKHPLRVIDLNWDMFDTIDTNRVRDIDMVYFKPLDRKRSWIDKNGHKIFLDYDNYEDMLRNSFALMNRTVTRMDPSMKKQARLNLLSRTKYFISLDPATFRSVEAAMVGCLSIVMPVPGVNKSEWASVSYSPEYLQYGIAYGFNDLDHARSTMGLVMQNLHDQDRKTREILVDFVKDIKKYFNLDPDFLKEKLS